VRRYAGCPVHLAFEACGFGYEVAWWAREGQIAVTVIAPSRMERAPGLQVKTDRLDVGRMARQLEDGSLKGIYVPERAGHGRRLGRRVRAVSGAAGGGGGPTRSARSRRAD
jgi:hypothetical protein